jgi:hypothetical protein
MGLQNNKKRVKRTSLERDEREIAKIIKRFTQCVGDYSGMELESQ